MMTIRHLILTGALLVPMQGWAGCGVDGTVEAGPAMLADHAGGRIPARVTPPRRTEAGLIPQSRPLIADLPMPIGFKLVEATSQSIQSPGGRLIDQTYKGRDDRVEVERFYLRQMPIAGWTWRESTMIEGVQTLRFDKDAHRCVLSISRASRPLRDAITVIHVDVRPDDGTMPHGAATAPDVSNP